MIIPFRFSGLYVQKDAGGAGNANRGFPMGNALPMKPVESNRHGVYFPLTISTTEGSTP